MSADALTSAGLVDPGGDPRELAHHAQSWADLSRYLDELGTRVMTLGKPDDRWQGSAADAFSRSVAQLSKQAEKTAAAAAEMAAAQREHAVVHQSAREIIIELSVQIAAMLAFYAAAAAFPALLSWAQAWLSYLVSTGASVLRVLASALQKLVQVMVRTRTLLQWTKDLSVVTSRGRIGYGNAVVEGARDFTVEASAHLVSQGIQGNPIDPAKLFVNAAIGGGVGAIAGLVEKSGVTKALGGLDGARAGSHERPGFETFENQARRAVGGTGRAQVPPRVPSAADEAIDVLLTSHARAGEVGVRGTRAEAVSLARAVEVTTARHADAAGGHASAVHRAQQAGDQVVDTEALLHRRIDELHQARADLSAAESTLSVFRDSGMPGSWAEEATRAVTEGRVAYAHAAERAGDTRELVNRAREGLATAEESVRRSTGELAAAEAAAGTARARLAAHGELVAAREMVQQSTTLPERLSAARNAGVWTDTFGTPTPWRESLLYDAPKDGLKGMATGAGKGTVDVSEGKSSPDDIWKRALLGGAGGAARGVVNSSVRNVALPSGGVAETTWKTGSRTLDDYVQRKIRHQGSRPG
ncbi:hypothetical protein [Lentzea sp. NPDC059081]|uniref:hypothetical protein n=1 Tax=Lentzea sp. NPDC059081 TaxID=3346719 RepID=UPI0036B10023